jgi:hypothetical protein
MDKTVDVKKLSTRQVKGKTINVAGGKETERLGYVVLFTVGSVEVPHAEIKEWWAKQDVLSEAQMPRKPTAIDAFRNTCSMENINIWERVDADLIKENEAYFKEKGTQVRVEYLTTPNPNNRDEYVVTRRVWIQPVGNEDAKMVVPEYPNVVRLRYDNQKDEIDTIPFENYIGSDVVVDIDRVANEEFQRQKTIVNGTRHRNLIRNVIEECGGIHLLGSGGTYFLPADGYAKLEKLDQYFDEVVSRKEYATTGHRCDIMTLDAFDDEKMRQRIEDDVASEVTAQYNALLDDTLEYLEKNAAKESDKEQAIIQRSLDARLKNAERIGILKDKYERMLGVKITVEQAVRDAPKNMTGRAAAVMLQMQRAALGEVE